MAIRKEELDAVLALPGPKRYSYFIKKVADFEKIWGLWSNEGWALAGNDEGNELFPVWPKKEFAKECIKAHWLNCEPKEIELKYFLDRWIPGMTKDQKKVAVFYTPIDKGVVVTPQRLREDLEAELTKYE